MNKIVSTLSATLLGGMLCTINAQTQKSFERKTFDFDTDKEVIVKEAVPGSLTKVPDNIVNYFESKDIADWYTDYFNKSNITELQKFKEGKRKYYPVNEVRDALHAMQRNIEADYHYNGVISSNDVETYQNVFYNFIDIAVMLCKDINHLSNLCSSDHMIGLLDFCPGYEGIFYHSIIYNTGNGRFKAHTLDIADNENEMEHIRRISQDENKAVYTVSREGMSMDGIFDLFVVTLYKNGKIESYRPANHDNALKEWFRSKKEDYNNDTEILFNPKKVCWEFCYLSGNVFKRVEGTKALYLEFHNGKPVYTVK